jgi:lipoate---protein ligase
MGGWAVTTVRGDAGAFHASVPTARRSATFLTVVSPTLVLGSAQPDGAADQRVADALGVKVVRRRSGGGAVLLQPDEFVWLDLVIPAGDSLWLDDVGRAMLWVGELWQRALAGLGVASQVHRGGLVPTEWSRQVCFAGLGTGEVVAGGSKLVGISQRRTREYARFQSMCHLRWRPELVAALVAAPRPTAADVAGAASSAQSSAAAVVAALSACLTD